jgi:hypothetical protein
MVIHGRIGSSWCNCLTTWTERATNTPTTATDSRNPSNMSRSRQSNSPVLLIRLPPFCFDGSSVIIIARWLQCISEWWRIRQIEEASVSGPSFEKAYPNIKLNWVVLPENELRA